MDIIAAIDAATAPTCGWCEAALGGTRQSDDFCSQDHQQLWHARQSNPLTTYVERCHWGGDRARWFDRDRWYQALLDEVERAHPQYELTSRAAAQEAFERWAELTSPGMAVRRVRHQGLSVPGPQGHARLVPGRIHLRRGRCVPRTGVAAHAPAVQGRAGAKPAGPLREAGEEDAVTEVLWHPSMAG